jgi:hypothetical protein
MHTLMFIILIIVSSTCFEHPSVRPHEGLYMQFYGISIMYQTTPHIDQTAYMDPYKKYH